jgi:hypothetical protein
MRTVVDTAPPCRPPAHADHGTDCGRVDQGSLTIGTRLTTAKERSLRFLGSRRSTRVLGAVSAGGAVDQTAAGRTPAGCVAGLEQPSIEPEPDHDRSDTCRHHGELWDERGHSQRPLGAAKRAAPTIV